MQSAEEQLAAIGFGRRRSEAVCWRSMRLDFPRSARGAPEAGCSAALLSWREVLAHGARPSPYRIRRVEK